MEEPRSALAVRAPLLLPACAVVAGAWIASRALTPAVPCLVALACLALALGGRWRALAWGALGMLWSSVSWVEPSLALAALSPHLPVELAGEVSGCWVREVEGDGAVLLVRWARQGSEVTRVAGRVRIHLPAAAEPRGCGGGLAVRGWLRPPRTYRNAVTTTVGGWSLWVKSEALSAPLAPPGPLSRVSALLRRRVFAAEPPRPSPAGVGDELAPWERAGAATGRGEPRDHGSVQADRRDVPRRTAGEAPGLGLARALLLGDGHALPAEQREAMRRLGLAHLVAVSGLNVGMVAVFLLAVLVAVPRPLRLAATLAGVTAYALLVGPTPSLLRALLMAATVLVGLLLHRLPQSTNGLACACLLMVLLDPAWVEDLGFQLSVAATVGLLALARPLAVRLRRCGPLALPLAVTLAAQVATLPWSLAAFQRLSPISPLANLVAVPWSAAALAVALAWAAARVVAGAAADPLLAALDALAAPLAWLPAIPASPWINGPLQVGWVPALAATGALVWWILRPAGRWLAVARVGGAVALVGVCAARAPPGLEVVLLDVGQGDAVLLRDGARAILVDGGGWRRPGFGGRVLVPALGALGVRRLHAVVVTHGDVDHCGGVADLLAELPVGELWVPVGELGGESCGGRLAAARVAQRHTLAAGSELAVGRWRLRVLAPRAGQWAASENDRSLVLLAAAGGRRVLLTGDVQAAGEREVLARWGGDALACDLLKVAHHGSRSSTSASWLAATSPRLAVISAGRGNPYGHPSPVVLSRLADAGVPLLRTDAHGMVRVRWRPGGRWRIALASP